MKKLTTDTTQDGPVSLEKINSMKGGIFLIFLIKSTMKNPYQIDQMSQVHQETAVFHFQTLGKRVEC